MFTTSYKENLTDEKKDWKTDWPGANHLRLRQCFALGRLDLAVYAMLTAGLSGGQIAPPMAQSADLYFAGSSGDKCARMRRRWDLSASSWT